MAYVETTSESSVLTWTNPYGGDSHIKIVDGQITEFVVEGANNTSIIHTLNQTDIDHLKTVTTDIIAFLTPIIE